MTPPHSKKGLKQQQQQQQHSICSVTKGSKESLVWQMDVVFVVVNVRMVGYASLLLQMFILQVTYT